MGLKWGKADKPTDAPTHVKGIKQGNSTRQLREAGRPPVRRPLDRRALDRHQRVGGASRSTRGCRTCRRPSGGDEPGHRRGAGRSRSPCSTRRRSSAPRRRRSRSRCASTRPAARRSARCCSTCSSRSPRAGGATTRTRRSGCSSCSGRQGLGLDAAQPAVDARDARRAGVHRLDGRRPAGAVHLRHGRARDALPRRARGRRGAARVPVQRHASSTRAPAGSCRPRGSRGRATPSTGCR